MVGQIWTAHAQVDILCSENLREALLNHAKALNDVSLHQDRYQDFWDHVQPYKGALLDAIRDELRWSDMALSQSHGLTTR